MFKQVFSASLMAATLAAAPSFAASKPPAAAAPATEAGPVSALPAQPPGKHSANPAAGPHGRSPERFVQRLEKELKLTPEQTVKVREILAKDAPAAPAQGKQGRMAGGKGAGPIPFRSGFAAQMRAANVDTAALDREWSERASRRQEAYAKMRDRFVALHAVLTPAQRAQLADRMERRGGKPRHGEDRREGRG